MSKIIGFDRHQLHFSSLEDVISHDNEVRFIDAFVEKLDLKLLGVNSLSQSEKKKTGRPAFCDKIFLKLYLYAYLNGIRSSRKLEREATLNIELHWLLEGLRPNYHSIADFRKLNSVALQNLFKLFVLFLKDAGLVGGKVIAVERNKANYEAHPKLYRKRQEINEHIFGTIKRQWNLYYTNLRGLEKVNGELALIMTVYNLKRAKNILGIDGLMEKLSNWTPKYPTAGFFVINRAKKLHFKPFCFLQINLAA
ncbi:MAG: transposase [Weeksellaceae bacterium]